MNNSRLGSDTLQENAQATPGCPILGLAGRVEEAEGGNMGQASVSSATGGICGEVDRFENLCRYGHFAREGREEENRY